MAWRIRYPTDVQALASWTRRIQSGVGRGGWYAKGVETKQGGRLPGRQRLRSNLESIWASLGSCAYSTGRVEPKARSADSQKRQVHPRQSASISNCTHAVHGSSPHAKSHGKGVNRLWRKRGGSRGGLSHGEASGKERERRGETAISCSSTRKLVGQLFKTAVSTRVPHRLLSPRSSVLKPGSKCESTGMH